MKPITPLGCEIRNQLAKRGLSQKEFAESIGITPETLTYIIRGNNKNGIYTRYGEGVVLRIVNALEISLANIK